MINPKNKIRNLTKKNFQKGIIKKKIKKIHKILFTALKTKIKGWKNKKGTKCSIKKTESKK